MKTKMTVVVGALAAAALAVSLAGCSGGEDVKKAEEPVSASQAFNAKGVWFRSSDTPEKDERRCPRCSCSTGRVTSPCTRPTSPTGT